MNLLLLLGRVPSSAECARSSVDGDWLVALAAVHRITVVVDEDSPALTTLRDQGVTVHVSDKRHVYLPGGRFIDADEALSGWLLEQHRATPFDLVLTSSDRPVLGHARAPLGDVPWAVAAATGPAAHANRLALDEQWMEAHGHELWQAGSAVAAADLVISPVQPRALGLHSGRKQVKTLLPMSMPQRTGHARGDLVVVVATGVGHAAATAMMEDALRRIDLHPALTVIVLHSPAPPDAEGVRPALRAGIPIGVEEQVVLVPTGRYSRAGAWIDAADALVLADATEFLIPAVNRRAAAVPTVVIGDDPDPGRVNGVLDELPRRHGGGSTELLPWTNPQRIADELRGLRRTSTLDMVVVHTDAAVEEATRWRTNGDLTTVDVVLAAQSRPPWGMPRADRLDGGLVALHRRTWTAVADALPRVADLAGLVAMLGDPAGATSHTLAVIGRDEVTVSTSPATGSPPLVLTGGPLPRVRLPSPPAEAARAASRPARAAEVDAGLRAWARTTTWGERARLALPWSLGLRSAIEDGRFPDSVVEWARTHTALDRARMALPWRYGMLPRAMEGHW